MDETDENSTNRSSGSLGEHRLEHQCGLHLRIEHRRGGNRRAQRDDFVLQRPGCVEDAVHRAERAWTCASAARIEARSAASAAMVITSAPLGPQCPHTADAAAGFVARRMRGEPLVEAGFIGKRRTTEQHQLDACMRGQMFGNPQRDAAQSAGQQVHAAIAQPGPLRGGCKPDLVKAAHPAIVAAQCDFGAGHLSSELAQQAARRPGCWSPAAGATSMLVQRTWGYSRGITLHGPSTTAFSGMHLDIAGSRLHLARTRTPGAARPASAANTCAVKIRL